MKLLAGEAYYFFSWHWDGTSTPRGEHYQERVIIKRLIQISLHSAICHKCVQFKWQMFPNVALPFQPPCITVWMRHFLCIDGFIWKAHPCTSKGFPAAALKHYLPVLLYLNLHFCASKAIQTGIRAGMPLIIFRDNIIILVFKKDLIRV